MSPKSSNCSNPVEPFWRCVLNEYSDDDDDDDDIEERETVQERTRGLNHSHVYPWRTRKPFGSAYDTEDDTDSRESFEDDDESLESCVSVEKKLLYKPIPKTPRSAPQTPSSLVQTEAEHELAQGFSTDDDDVAVERLLQSTNSYISDQADTTFERDGTKQTSTDNFYQDDQVISVCSNVDAVDRATTTDETVTTPENSVEDLQRQEDESEDARGLKDLENERMVKDKRSGSRVPVDDEQEVGNSYSSEYGAIELVLQDEVQYGSTSMLKLLRRRKLQPEQPVLQCVEPPPEVQKMELKNIGTETSPNGLASTTGEVEAHLTPVTVPRATMRAKAKNAITQKTNRLLNSLFRRRDGSRSCPLPQE